MCPKPFSFLLLGLLALLVPARSSASEKGAAAPLPNAGGAQPWPEFEFAEVRAYAWPAKLQAKSVILPGADVTPGAINKKGTVLNRDQIARLHAAVTGKHPANEQARCYIPHNALVFYNKAGLPVAYIEVCFTCHAYKARVPGGSAQVDLVALATLFHELKLPIGPYPDPEAFKRAYLPVQN